MSILLIGATGHIGAQVAQLLADRGAAVRALVRQPETATLPAGVTAFKGDLLDVDSMRAALSGVDTLFLLNAVVPDELTQAMLALSLAREAGLKGYVYFSVQHAERFTDVPHFASKYAVERLIEAADLPATILRPSYFMQNDVTMKDALTGPGLYPMPVGDVGVSLVDTRDIAEVAAAALWQRHQAAAPLPRETIDVVGPQALTGGDLAAIWSATLGRPIVYGGNALDPFETRFKSFAPSWLAREIRLMLGRFQTDGMVGTPQAVQRMTALLGHAPRTYGDYAAATAAAWK